ncbi:hypothetical protein B0A48_05998 [Cryoendolithus antarcticus]|uniref:Uncharacterized protein n=1 Tax=Cryoendolithus antarcticus TaxID=1507870 RepID=A0A1V8TCJ2_9PEZI|nr:hypothetical protein B0A48_05998 [Cryoendolithus antarcticus]
MTGHHQVNLRMPFWKGKDYAHAKDCAQYIEAVVGGSIVMPQAIAVFATSHLNDPGQTGSSEATERKRVADGLLFASGRLTGTIINTITSGVLVGNRNERGTKAADYSTNAQSATLSYLSHTITRLVRTFEELPLIISSSDFPYENNTVDFENIWLGDVANHAKWLESRYWDRHLKVGGKGPYRRRGGWVENADKEDLERLYEVWKHHMVLPGPLDTLVTDLGGLLSLPICFFTALTLVVGDVVPFGHPNPKRMGILKPDQCQ